MGMAAIPTGLEDMPVVFVKAPYIEQTKNRRKIMRNLESMTNAYLRDLILSRKPLGAATERGSVHEHNAGTGNASRRKRP